MTTKADVSTDNTSQSTTDVVTLSTLAKDGPKDVALNNYAQFFAGRDGLSQSFTLSNAVTSTASPNDSVIAGRQKNFEQVAVDARASMDAQYAAMKATGKPFDINSLEGKDWNTLIGNLDRRSLYAVSSNKGGQFTKEEQQIAQSIMGQQESLALGLYSGPTSKAGAYVAPFTSMSDNFKNGINFLDSVSPEEKSSIRWAVERASAQRTYESFAEDEHKVPEKLDSKSPLVRLLMTAFKKMENNTGSGWTTGSLTTADDLKRQTWFKGFESQLDQIIQQQTTLTNTEDVLGG
jgi:hypothetical protein